MVNGLEKVWVHGSVHELVNGLVHGLVNWLAKVWVHGSVPELDLVG